MFYGCSSLKEAPELPALNLAGSCYYNMFYNCTSLIKAPKLPATAMANGCYVGMFSRCTSLETPPDLPAMELANNCYNGMFSNCTSLLTVPKLFGTIPSNKTTSYCCYYMFSNCKKIIDASSIIIDYVSPNSYYGMFNGCSALRKGPTLLTTTLNTDCFRGLFYGCSLLDNIKVNFTEWNEQTKHWVYNINNSGIFICPSELPIERSASGIPNNWIVLREDTNNEVPLSLVAQEANTSIKLLSIGNLTINGLQYRTISSSWTDYVIGEQIDLTNINDVVQFRNTENTLSFDLENYVNVSVTGKIEAYGKIESLINYSEYIPYCFYGLFKGCAGLTKFDELSNMNLSEGCYAELFRGCGRLTDMPKLPAVKVKNNSYAGMFYGCTALTGVTELPARILGDECYYQMFYNCNKIKTAPTLPSRNSKNNCYKQMFYGCTQLTGGIDVLPAPYLAPTCYSEMFRSCTSLITAPKISGTILGTSCCYQTFFGCSSLTGGIDILPAMNLKSGCYYGMFNGCTSLKEAPILPATSLSAQHCYHSMFNGCSNLSLITVNFTDWKPTGVNTTTNWVNGVAASGTFICPSELSQTSGVNYIPSGWTVQNPSNNSTVTLYAVHDGTGSWGMGYMDVIFNNVDQYKIHPANNNMFTVNMYPREEYESLEYSYPLTISFNNYKEHSNGPGCTAWATKLQIWDMDNNQMLYDILTYDGDSVTLNSGPSQICIKYDFDEYEDF